MLSARGGGGGGGGGGGPHPADTDLSLRHEVRALKGGEAEGGPAVDTSSLLVVKATIKHIRNDAEKIAYPACRNARDGGRQCNKRLENQMGQWSCQLCGAVDAPEYRYMVSACLQDASGDNFVTIFDQEAQQLLGVKAADLLAMGGAIGEAGAAGGGGEPGPQYMRTFQQQLFTQHLFTIKCKADTYKDEQKLSATVVKLRALKGPLLVQECHALANNIKKYLSA
jgi:replication factor A1